MNKKLDLLKSIEWNELQKQKITLLSILDERGKMIGKEGVEVEKVEGGITLKSKKNPHLDAKKIMLEISHLNGLVVLIETLQDLAIEAGLEEGCGASPSF